MARQQKIPEMQMQRVHRLEQMFEVAVARGDLKKAKQALDDLKNIFDKYHHEARKLQGYLKLYEAALELWELNLAKRGFELVRKEANKNTRMYLEATALLAIAHLREQNLTAAEPYIVEVLRNDTVIKTETSRAKFRKEIIERFDQEGALAALAKCDAETFDDAQIHQEAINLLKQGKDENDLREYLGSKAPQSVKDFILKVDQLGKKLLPYKERLLLPSPKDIVNNRQTGDVIFYGIKRRVYQLVCDESSEVYQAWVHKGIDFFLGESFVTGTVLVAMADLKIGLKGVAVGFSAMLMKSGVNNFCDKNQPNPIMGLRKKRN